MLIMVLCRTALSQGIYQGGRGGGWASATYQVKVKNTRTVKILSNSGTVMGTVEGVPEATSAKISVYDCLGRKLEGETLPSAMAQFQLKQTYAKGMYMVVLEAQDRKIVKKIIL